MKRRRQFIDALREVLTGAEEVADRCMKEDAGAQARDRNIYKLGALEQGVKSLIARLEAEDNSGRVDRR